MPEYTERLIQRLVTIAMNEEGITHGFQVRTLQGFVDGEPKGSVFSTDQENVEPAEIGKVFPRADLVKQITELRREMDAAAKAAAGAAEVAARIASDEIAARDAVIAERDVKIAQLTAAYDQWRARAVAAVTALQS